jgi:autotransporter-associated beta strand protein
MNAFTRFGLCGMGLSVVLVADVVCAADFTWLDAPASANWNETDANWSGAGAIWSSAKTNSAIFSSSVSTVKNITAGSLTLSNLTFTADGYAIGGGPLLMSGGFTVGGGASALVTATVTNQVGVCEKKDTGALILNSGDNATNLFSTFRITQGTVQVTGGTVEISTNDNNNIYLGFDVNGGTLLVSGGKIRTTSTGYSDIRGVLLITNGVVDLSSSRETLNAFNGAGTTTVSGNGLLDVNTFRVSQYNANAASQNAINVNTGGVIRLNSFTIDPGASPKGMVNFNGGTVIAKTFTQDFLGTWTNKWVNGIFSRILEGGAVIDTGANAISIKLPLISGASADGGLTKKGTGILSLLSTNNYNGPTVIAGGTLTFDPQTYTQTLSSTITCAATNCTLAKGGSGMLVLDPGATAVNSFGTLWCSNGTVVVVSGTNLVTCPNSGQNAPGLRVSGGTLLVAGGVLKTTALMFVNVDGGHLLVTNGLVDTTSCYEVLNGIGGNGFGYTTVRDNGVIIANRVRISQNSGNATNTVVTVSTGGVLRVSGFYIDITFPMQKGMLVLNGGTVESRSSTADFLGTTATFVGNANDKWLTNVFVRVREGGAIFNTAGYDISIKQPLLTDVVADGGFIKRGAGTLTLLNTNGYSGVTAVEAGTLKLGTANALWSAGSASVSSGAVFDVNGVVQSLAGLGGSGTVTNNASLSVAGTVAPGGTNAVGTLLLATPCPLSGTFRATVSSAGNCGQLRVNGNLDLSGLTVSVANSAALNKNKRYVIATYTGALTSGFSSLALPLRWFVRYDTAGRQVWLMYNPGTLLSLL